MRKAGDGFMLNILYEDAHIMVVVKPVGIESQSARGFGADMVSEIKRHIHKLSKKSEEPYVGVIHRLDKPVSGILVYAKDKKSASALSRQMANRAVEKEYLAILCGKPVNIVEKYVDYMLKDGKENVSRVVDMGITGAKRAELTCCALDSREIEPYGLLTLAAITLGTGRHHQIRVQMAEHGLPLWGDNRYNPSFKGSHVNVALAAHRLLFRHPVSGKPMNFEYCPDGELWRQFSRQRKN